MKAAVSRRDNMVTSPHETHETPFSLCGTEGMKPPASLWNGFKETFQLHKEKECLGVEKKLNSAVAARM